MSREKKIQIIDSLGELFTKCSVGVLTDYRGLSAPEMTSLRRRLGELGVEFRVIKNTLARFAAKRAGKDELVSFFEGPTAIASGYGDITEPAKALADYMRTAKTTMNIRGAFLGSRIITAEQVRTLATLPPREVLLARVVGGMQSPIVVFISQLAAPFKGLMRILQARIQQLEGGQDVGK